MTVAREVDRDSFSFNARLLGREPGPGPVSDSHHETCETQKSRLPVDDHP